MNIVTIFRLKNAVLRVMKDGNILHRYVNLVICQLSEVMALSNTAGLNKQ